MNELKIVNSTYAEAMTNKAKWQEGMTINLVDKSLPIPADKVGAADSVDKDKVPVVQADGSYKLEAVAKSLNIQASSDTEVDGFDTPLLTAEQVTSAYNQIVGGGSCTITNASGEVTFNVQLGDASTGDPSILIPHYWLGFVDYQVSGTSVNITAHKIPQPAYSIQSVTIGTDTIDITLV